MPFAEKITPKQQRRNEKARRHQAKIDGAREDFPGAPIWNDWVKEKHEAKKREVGLPRRIGRSALELAAVSVLVSKKASRGVSNFTRDLALFKENSYQRSVNAGPLFKTESVKENPGRVRRFGRGVLGAIERSNDRSKTKGLARWTKRADAAVDRAHKKSTERSKTEQWAHDKITAIDKKRLATARRRRDEYEAEKQQAWAEYLDKNPDVKEQMRIIEAERKAKQRQHDLKYEHIVRSNQYARLRDRAKLVTDYFTERNFKNNDVYSFSKSIPNRSEFSGSYDELARSGVERGARYRREDGSIPLLGREIFTGIINDKLPLSPDNAPRDGGAVSGYGHETPFNTVHAFRQRQEAFRREFEQPDSYLMDVGASLWKMGFVEYGREEDTSYGTGGFNPDIEWSSGDDGMRFASIPYDPDNELHKLVAGDVTDMTPDARIQLAIGGEKHAPEMSVGLYEPIISEAAA